MCRMSILWMGRRFHIVAITDLAASSSLGVIDIGGRSLYAMGGYPLVVGGSLLPWPLLTRCPNYSLCQSWSQF